METNLHKMPIYQTAEDLPENLRKWVTRDGDFSFFKHPLYVTLMPALTPEPIGIYLARRQQQVDKHLATGEISRAVFTYERAYRPGKLYEYADEYLDHFMANPRTFWDLVGRVWIDTEFPHNYQTEWSELLIAQMPYREYMMDEVEREAFSKLPNHITVWRGVSASDEDEAREWIAEGFSWTRNEAKAKWFAGRWRRKGTTPYIAKATVRKADALALFLGRKEDEILTMPDAPAIEYIRKVGRK